MFSETVTDDISGLGHGCTHSEWPSEISLDRQARTLDLLWDGRHISVSHKILRRSCRCSVCESIRRKLEDVIPVACDVEIIRIEPVGTIGLQFFFSDDHDRGIYPWAYLHQLAYGAGETGFTESLMKGWRDE